MFHLPFFIPSSKDKINLSNQIVLLGSCFADEIGAQLAKSKLKYFYNPFGTIYNPITISQLILDEIDTDAIIESHGIYYHWQTHGEVSSQSRSDLNDLVLRKRVQMQSELTNANWLIVTLGSAFAYRLKSSAQIVANCHKVPQSEFTKELLSVEIMTNELRRAISELKGRNPKLQVILTVSPVRHTRDGWVENNRSKARLIEAVHTLKSDYVSYFPAYEIMIDELRDYRFYAKDRVHPSEEAIDYIWNRFGETYFDDATRAFIKEWQHIRNAIHHRPFHPTSDEHQAFLRATIDKLNVLSTQVDVSAEVSLLQKQLL